MVKLNQEKETLVIPLYGKAMDYRSGRSLLMDSKADEIVASIDYPFDALKIDHKTNVMMTLRAKLIDDYVMNYIEANEDVITLHLGCGLDSRSLRIKDMGKAWVDVDYSEVIELRKNFFTESDRASMIGTSVTEEGWIEQLRFEHDHCLVVAEGLFMYLSDDEIQKLVERLGRKFDLVTLIFDAYSKMTAKHAGNHPSLKRTGAVIKWGMDRPSEFESMVKGASYIKTIYLTDNQYTQQLPRATRIAYGIANTFKMAKEAHRILVYRVK